MAFIRKPRGTALDAWRSCEEARGEIVKSDKSCISDPKSRNLKLILFIFVVLFFAGAVYPQTDGATALHWAVYHEDLEAIDRLIAAGAKVDVKNSEGVTPLHLASLFGNSRIIDRLIKAGSDAKQTGPAGETMLMLAARNGNPDAIKSLAAAGADVNAKEPIRGT